MRHRKIKHLDGLVVVEVIYPSAGLFRDFGQKRYCFCAPSHVSVGDELYDDKNDSIVKVVEIGSTFPTRMSGANPRTLAPLPDQKRADAYPEPPKRRRLRDFKASPKQSATLAALNHAVTDFTEEARASLTGW
jgi:hypothetical protein